MLLQTKHLEQWHFKSQIHLTQQFLRNTADILRRKKEKKKKKEKKERMERKEKKRKYNKERKVRKKV